MSKYFPRFDARLNILYGFAETDLRSLWEEERAGFAADVRAGRASRSRAFTLTAGVYFPGTHGFPLGFPQGSGPVFSVLILCDGSAADLRQGKRVLVRSRSGDVFVTHALRADLERLHEMHSVRFIELAGALRPCLADAGPQTGLTQLHNDLLDPHKGEGVLVGVVDRYLDFHHPDFGEEIPVKTRVHGLWDQELVSTTPAEKTPEARDAGASPLILAGLDYGVEYVRSMVQDDLDGLPYSSVRHEVPTAINAHNNETDDGTDEHGTHVAGIAVGNGSDSHSANVGAAPKANLIFVHQRAMVLGSPIADASDVLDGAKFVFERARQAQQPCVLNLSLSDGQGAHDGTSLRETYLDELLDRPGRAIVISAGNDNDTSTEYHAEADVGAVQDLILIVGPASNRSEEIQVWYPAAASLSLDVAFDDGTPAGIPIGLTVKPGDGPTALPQAGPSPIDVLIDVVSIVHDPRNGDNLILLTLRKGTGGVIPSGSYRFRFTPRDGANGRLYAWVSGTSPNVKNNPGIRFDYPLMTRNSTTLGVPSSGKQLITVGENRTATPDQLNPESGWGKSRDQRDKPDLVSPAPLQSSSSRNRRRGGGNYAPYTSFGGTSASAPLVAGAAAIVFECWGSGRDWDFVRTKLRGLAQMPPGIAYPNPAWGWGSGKLFVGALCAGATRLDLENVAAQAHMKRPDLLPGIDFPIVLSFPLAQLEPGPETFEIRDLAHRDGLQLRTNLRHGAVALELPLAALPVRDEAWLESIGGERALFGDPAARASPPWGESQLDAQQAYALLDIEGAPRVERLGDVLRIHALPMGVLFIPRLRLAHGATLPIRVISVGALEQGPKQPGVVLNRFRRGRWMSGHAWMSTDASGGVA